MIKVKMVRTARGADRSNDGVSFPVAAYIEGKTYEVGDSLGKAFLEMGVAVKASEKPLPPENKELKPEKEAKKKKAPAKKAKKAKEKESEE